MRLSCLGQLRLQDQAGNELTPRTRKARALLAVLALSGRPCSREGLADLLWSDRGGDQARSSFRQAIFELRHLENAGAAVTSPVRDTVSLNAELITTDLWAIRAAAEADDFESLEAVLSSSGSGLLTDLDGLDSEFDAWLQVERAQEPSRTLATAVAAAERCLEQFGLHAARGIVAEVQRLDPSSEEAARLAMRIAHRQGDSGSLNRHFELLRERLRADFDAEPSRETQELFNELSASHASSDRPALVASKADSMGDATSAPATDGTPLAGTLARGSRATRTFSLKRWSLAIPALVVVGGLAVLAWKPESKPTLPAELPLVAVLPFEQYPKGDGALAEGLWDDTRALLSQNGTVRVLGRTTSQAIANDKLAPRSYRDRLGVTYILDGSVQQQGDRVRVNVSLTRTSDGVSIWGHSFDGRLGDAFALQGAVAQGIEGRIRGRLARGGGARADQIATSPEVYALYSEARALLRARDRDQANAAEGLLRRAVALDANYAPAWASLGAALYFGRHDPQRSAQRRALSLAYVHRALALAPNLAHAHATLALIAGKSPSSEESLERAVALDPGYGEAWLWLGNVRTPERRREAVAAYARAVEIDPLWWPAAQNMAARLTELGDRPSFDRLVARVSRAGADREFILSIHAEADLLRGDYSQVVGPLLAVRRERPGKSLEAGRLAVIDGLLRLGYQDEAGKLWNQPKWFGPLLRSEMLPSDRMSDEPVGPKDFWAVPDFPAFTSRAMLNLGRGRGLVEIYHRGFRSRDEFVQALDGNQSLLAAIPNVAVALRTVGDDEDARYLLAAAEKRVELGLASVPGDRDLSWELGRIRAAQRRPDDALQLIAGAVARGWLPDGNWYALDLAQEPSLRSLRGDPRFKALRARILAHIARERAELGPVEI